MCLWVTSQSNHLWRLSKHWILAKCQALNCSGSSHKEPSGPTTSSSGYFPNSRMCNWNRHTWDLIGFPNWFPYPWSSSVQFSSVTQSCLTLWDPMDCSTPGLPVHHQLPEFTQTHVHWLGDAIHTSHPLSSPSPPALNLSQHQFFSNESVLRIRSPKYWSFSFNISPSNEY